MAAPAGDLSVTALYTSGAWTWGGLSCAHLFATPEAKRVFDATNLALAAARVFRRGSSLRHALLHRHTMIDHLLRESGFTQVVELAAGLSRRGAAFTAAPAVRYTELDLPHVIERKRTLLDRTDEGRAVLARPGLRLIAGDVETVELEPLVEREPVFVIAEGLMMYLAADAQRRLFARVRRLAEHTGAEVRFVFDLVPACEQPAPGVAGKALEAVMKRFTGGRSFERDVRTRTDLAGELRAAGFGSVEVLDATAVARRWRLPYPDERTQLVLFSATSGASRSTPS